MARDCRVLNMNSEVLVVIVYPEICNILETDLLGRSAGDRLAESLKRLKEADVRIVLGEHARHGYECGKIRNLAQCQSTALHSTMPTGQGLLIIDARAWFSSAALLNISSLVQGATNSLRFVESSTGIFASHREAMTLAVYLPHEMVVRDLFVCERTSDGVGLEQVVNPEVIMGAIVVTCSEMSAPLAALMLVSQVDLAELERYLLLVRAMRAMQKGVRIHDPKSIYIRGELVCDVGVTLEPNVIVEGVVVLGAGVKIGANSILRNCQIGANTSINPFSLVEQSSIGTGSFIGPYGRIRPGCVIGDNVQIGNYVEIKNSRIGDGCRINHHSFMGDALLATHVTIGAGTITCNHDGVGIHQTVIEHGAYVGSGCNLVAPLNIGENAVVGAGSTITHNVPAAKLTVARQRQITIEHWSGPKTRRTEK